MPRATISLPKPDHDFAVEESKKLMFELKGEKKKNLSAFLAELVRARREAVEKMNPRKKAA